MGIINKHLKRTLPERWEQVLEDPRRDSRVWDFGSLLRVVMNGLVSGCKSLREIEMLTETSGTRVPDTTLHDLLVQIDPEPLNDELSKGVKEANRCHELDHKELPFRLTVIDGKNLSVTDYAVDENSINRSQKGCKQYVHLALRAFHVSSTLKLLMGQKLIPKGCNEMGTFQYLLEELKERYGRTKLLEVFSMDAGFTGASNAKAIIDSGYDYIFALKAAEIQPITATAERLLGQRSRADATATESVGGDRITRRLYRCEVPAINGWPHAKEFWRVQKETVDVHAKTTTEEHFYVTNLSPSRLSHTQVLKTIRMHWCIENNANWIMDTVWNEDLRPWCNRALELISLLRMLAYNAVARLKVRRLKQAKKEDWSWQHLLQFIQRVLFPANESSFATL